MGGLAKNALTRPLVIVVAIALMVMTFGQLTPARAAGESGVEGLGVRVVFDGEGAADTCDTGGDPRENGIVATNDAVGFEWAGTFPEIGTEYTLTQTLPVGWEWADSAASFLTSDGGNAVYRSVGSLTNNGRTLTAVVTPLQSNLSIFLGTLQARPTSAVADGATYTPTIHASSASGSEQATTTDLTVCSNPITTLRKARHGQVTSTIREGVQGRSQHYRLYVTVPADGLGQQAGTTIAAGGTITDTWDGPTESVFIPGSMPASVRWDRVPGTNTVVFTFDEDVPAGQSYEIRYDVWWPDSVLPALGANPLLVTNTATADWSVPPQTNNVQTVTSLTVGGASSGVGSTSKSLYWATPDSNPTVPTDPAIQGTGWTNMASDGTASVASGSLVMARVYHQAARVDGVYIPYDQRTLTDEWDHTQQRLLSGDIWVSYTGNTALPNDAYTVEYRNADTGTWSDSVASAGGLDVINGVRVDYIGGTAEGQRYVLMAIPFEVIAADGTASVTDTATTEIESAGFEAGVSARTATYGVGSKVIDLSKEADRAIVASGDDVVYTLTPTLAPTLGADHANASALVVTDTLPANVESYEVVNLDNFWVMLPETQVSGETVLTFRHLGTVTESTVIPPIVIKTTTSVQAPAGEQMTNVATFAADDLSVEAAASVTVFQSNVIAVTKSAEKPVIEINADDVSWTTKWFNYQTVSQGLSYVVDVLPYDGDPRGTDFTGTFTLSELELTAQAVANVSVEYTTQNPTVVAATPAHDPQGQIMWQDVADLSSPPTDATALRVVIGNFGLHAEGLGSLKITGTINGHTAGDVYSNSVFSYISTNDAEIPETSGATSRVVSSTVSGRVVVDADQTGSYGTAMPGLEGVEVGLFAADDLTTPVDTTTTGLLGYYAFETSSGDYVVRLLDVPTEYAPSFSPAGSPGGRETNPFSVGLDEEIIDLHFGEYLQESTVAVEKSVIGDFALADPELADLTFTVNYSTSTNESGQVTLSADNDWASELAEEFPVGTVVTLTEADVDASDLDAHVAWEGYEWTPAGGYDVSPDGLTATVEIVAGDVPTLHLQNSFAEVTGGFAVTKEVTGEAADRVPGDTEFIVEYSLDGGNNWAALDAVSGNNPTAAFDGEVRAGTTVLLREQTPAVVTGVEWGEAAFSGSSVTSTGAGEASIVIAGDTQLDVLLTNPTTQRNGQVQTTKEITGDGIDHLSGDPEFVIQYFHQGLADPEELRVTAGQTATTPLLPEGTEVLIAEVAPEDGLVEGASWGEPRFLDADGTELGTSTTITIEAGEVIDLVLENPTIAPVPPAEEDDADSDDGVLPDAGTAISAGAVALGALLILLGLLFLRRRSES